MSPIDPLSPSQPEWEKPPTFATSPLADADLDGPGDLPRASRRDGLTFCPHCHGGIASNAELSGQIVNCPHCAQPFRMPDGIDPRPNPGVSRGISYPTGGVVSKEPWFYRFIETYASAWLWFNLFIIGIIDLGAIIMALRIAGDPAFAHSWAILVPLSVIVLMIPALLGVLLSVAFMRLAVDVARNLREIRQR